MGEENPIAENRSCRDVLFLILFGAFWVGMFAVGITAFSEGDPAMLQYGIDSSGNLCGSSKSASNYSSLPDVDSPSFGGSKKQYFLNPTQWQNPAFGLDSVCMKDCPTDTVLSAGWSSASAWTCVYHVESGLTLSGVDDWATDYYDELSTLQKAQLFQLNGPCYPNLMPMTEFLNRCVPVLDTELLAELGLDSTLSSETGLSNETIAEAINAFSNSRDYLQEYIGDMSKGWAIIVVAGVVASIGFSLIWMVFLRYMAGCMAWCTVLIVNLLFAAATILCAVKGGLVGEEELGADLPDQVTDQSDDSEYFKYATYVAAVLTVAMVLFTLVMFSRIKIAVACIKVASQAVACMPTILLFPIITYISTIVLYVWWIFVAAFLYASGEIVESCSSVTGNCSYTVEWTEVLQYMGVYHLFGLLWTVQFVIGFGYCVIAGSIATFYWSGGDSKKIPSNVVVSSLKRTVRYHMGSIALGAFIVAVIQMIRIVLEYLDRKTKNLQEGNPVLKYAMCIVKYCMWYLEKVMKFINRNAYILVAVKGTSYCSSALQAVKLIVNNILRLAAVNTVGDSLIFIGKICVTIICCIIAFLMSDSPTYTDADSSNYLSSPLLPIIVATFIAFCIASIFFQVYEMAVDTILLSFCEDCDQNSGDAKHAPKLLQEALGKSTPVEVKA